MNTWKPGRTTFTSYFSAPTFSLRHCNPSTQFQIIHIISVQFHSLNSSPEPVLCYTLLFLLINFAGLKNVDALLPDAFFLFCSFFTIGGSVRVEQVSQQAFLDGGIPTQGLVVQDEQEAVELHQELVQHCKTAQSKCCQLWENYFNPEWLLWDFTLWLVILKHWLLMKGVSRLLLEGERRAIRSLWSFQTEKIKPRHGLVFQCQIRSVRQPLTQDRV